MSKGRPRISWELRKFAQRDCPKWSYTLGIIDSYLHKLARPVWQGKRTDWFAVEMFNEYDKYEKQLAALKE